MPLSYDYVKVQNFKSLEDVRLELKKFNVMVGPNGSGKTNMIEAFIFARMVTRPPSSPGSSRPDTGGATADRREDLVSFEPFG
ncbi:MAG: AAA family ATPase [Conexivisphaera sp.]|jgi:AAA15 family ATPase/GTPase